MNYSKFYENCLGSIIKWATGLRKHLIPTNNEKRRHVRGNEYQLQLAIKFSHTHLYFFVNQ